MGVILSPTATSRLLERSAQSLTSSHLTSQIASQEKVMQKPSSSSLRTSTVAAAGGASHSKLERTSLPTESTSSMTSKEASAHTTAKTTTPWVLTSVTE